MVDRRHLAGYLSTDMNRHGHGGRVPPERKGLEPGYDYRLPRPRHHRRAGSLDVPASHRLVPGNRRYYESLFKHIGRSPSPRRYRLSDLHCRGGRHPPGWFRDSRRNGTGAGISRPGPLFRHGMHRYWTEDRKNIY